MQHDHEAGKACGGLLAIGYTNECPMITNTGLLTLVLFLTRLYRAFLVVFLEAIARVTACTKIWYAIERIDRFDTCHLLVYRAYLDVLKWMFWSTFSSTAENALREPYPAQITQYNP